MGSGGIACYTNKATHGWLWLMFVKLKTVNVERRQQKFPLLTSWFEQCLVNKEGLISGSVKHTTIQLYT